MRHFIPLLLAAITASQGVGNEWQQPCAIGAQIGAAWYYDWTSAPTCGTGTLEAVPMLRKAGDWGDRQGGNSRWLMGFNEPDRRDQADLTPAQAATAWRTVEQRFPGKRLVSPAPSGPGLAWLPQFRDAYRQQYGTWPRLDALAVHCYLPHEDCRAIVTQALAWADAWGVSEVWLTEWAALECNYTSHAQAIADADAFRAWLATQPRVTRAAWFNGQAFGACDPALVRDGALTAWGQWYMSR